ncbi:calcium-binding protein [Siccirubricoccus phaeus]|uniref:calcium-binding protein n=1 Tax=Siccirubricoccus phaeus TaxID=2595053 RepID=UPI00165B69B4|nr:M10 family metallopeptidase C-terminal domain-containing protein [Siccirubricoccus phaeus]
MDEDTIRTTITAISYPETLYIDAAREDVVVSGGGPAPSTDLLIRINGETFAIDDYTTGRGAAWHGEVTPGLVELIQQDGTVVSDTSSGFTETVVFDMEGDSTASYNAIVANISGSLDQTQVGQTFFLHEAVFADGTVIDLSLDNAFPITGSEESETLYGFGRVGYRASTFLRNDTIDGFGGDDRLDGLGGADLMRGGEGDDTLVGGNGNAGADPSERDTLDGGDGQDLADYSGANIRLATTLGDPGMAGIAVHGAAADTLLSIEHVIGTRFGDEITGNDLANAFSGGAGDDYLSGAGGSDTLAGGGGADTMIGGWGDDVFLFSALTDSTAAAPDHILDFYAGDRIDISAIDADGALAGDQAFRQVADFTGAAGEFTLAYDAATDITTASFATGGAGAEMVILLAGDVTALADDWVL